MKTETKRFIPIWRQIGNRLNDARAEFSNEHDFLQWVTKQNFGLKTDTLKKYCKAAAFLKSIIAQGHDHKRVPTDWYVAYRASCLGDTQ